MNQYAETLKELLKTPVKDTNVIAFHGETRCLTREARAIIRFVHEFGVLDANDLAAVFDSNKRAVERVVKNQYNGSKMDADDVEDDKRYIHPTLLGMLEDWAKKTKKQLRKERKRNASASSASSNESQDSGSGSEKGTKNEKGVEGKAAPATCETEDSQTSRMSTRRSKKKQLPSPPASTVEPSPAPESKPKLKRKRPSAASTAEPHPSQDEPKPKRARRSPAPRAVINVDHPSEFDTLHAFFTQLKYVPADLKRLNELGLGPAELLLTRTFEKEEAEGYFGDILKEYSKPIVVRAMAHVVYSAAEKHWAVLES